MALKLSALVTVCEDRGELAYLFVANRLPAGLCTRCLGGPAGLCATSLGSLAGDVEELARASRLTCTESEARERFCRLSVRWKPEDRSTGGLRADSDLKSRALLAESLSKALGGAALEAALVMMLEDIHSSRSIAHDYLSLTYLGVTDIGRRRGVGGRNFSLAVVVHLRRCAVGVLRDGASCRGLW